MMMSCPSTPPQDNPVNPRRREGRRGAKAGQEKMNVLPSDVIRRSSQRTIRWSTVHWPNVEAGSRSKVKPASQVPSPANRELWSRVHVWVHPLCAHKIKILRPRFSTHRWAQTPLNSPRKIVIVWATNSNAPNISTVGFFSLYPCTRTLHSSFSLKRLLLYCSPSFTGGFE